MKDNLFNKNIFQFIFNYQNIDFHQKTANCLVVIEDIFNIFEINSSIVNYYFNTDYKEDFVQMFKTDRIIACILSNFFHKECFTYQDKENDNVSVCLYLNYNDLNHWLMTQLVEMTGVIISIFSNKSLLGFKRVVIKEDEYTKVDFNTFYDEWTYMNFIQMSDKIYFNNFFYRGIRTKMKIYYENIYYINDIKSYFKFKWRRILFPVYVQKSYTHKYLFNYLIEYMKRRFKFNFSYVDLINLGLHPFQLLSDTIGILYSSGFNGSFIDECFQNDSSLFPAIKKNQILDATEVILYNITFNYSLINDPIRNILSDLLLICDHVELEENVYPLNCVSTSKEYKNKSTYDYAVEIRKNIDDIHELRKKFIESFGFVAMYGFTNPNRNDK